LVNLLPLFSADSIKNASQILARDLKELVALRASNGSQVVGDVLDLSMFHRADSKDTAHAERLAEVPHCINAPGVRATSDGKPSGASLPVLCLPAA